VDVWGHLYAPVRTLAQIAGRAGEFAWGHGRDLPSVATALLHGDIDAAFGRVHPPLPAGLAHRRVRLEPVDAWSLLWCTGNGHPKLNGFAAACAEEAGQSRWLEYDPTRDWLPEPPTSDPSSGRERSRPEREAPTRS
jgi:hypothetical protein